MLHPKTEHSHSHGLELENETDHKDYVIHGHGLDSGQHHQYETVENHGDYDGGSFGSASETKELGHQFQDITVHHGHQ